MKGRFKLCIFAALIIGAVTMSGCTSNLSTSVAPVAVSTPTPEIIYVTVLVTPTPTTHTMYFTQIETPVPQRTSYLEPSGPVSVIADSSSTISTISLYLQVQSNSVDMEKVTYKLSTVSNVKSFTSSQVNYDWIKQLTPHGYRDSHSGLLSPREMVLVTITPNFGTNLGVNERFILEVMPPSGAPLPVARTMPAELTKGKYYEVF